MNKRKKLIYFAFTLSLLTVFSVVMFNLEAFEEKKEFLNKENAVSTKKVVKNASEDIKETLSSKAVTEEKPTVEENSNIVDNIVPNVKQVVNNNDNNNNIKDNTITSPPEAKPAEKEEVPTIILEDSNVYVQELGEPKNELAMQVVTKDKNIEYGVDDSKVDYSKVGKYSVRFFARTFATNRQVEKVMPFTVADTKAPIIAIVPERTIDAASSVAVRLNIKDPSAITEKKYVWLNENDPIPADNDPLWIAMTAEDQVVETKDFNAVKEGTLSIAVQAVDNTNNKATVKSQEYQISQHVPENIVMQPSTTDFTNQDIKLTITYQNTPTRQKYKVQGQSWKDYTGEINITDNCYVYAQGTNGNKIAKKILNITNIDKKGPENIVIAPNIHFAHISDLKVDISITDNLSGFKINTPTNVQYKWVKKDVIPDTITWINAPLNTFNSNDKNVSFSVINSTDKGTYTLHVKATDYAGNTSTKVSGEYNLYNYDILPPTFAVTPETGWVKDKVTLEISHSASETGEEIYYSEDPNTDKATWTKYTAPIEITEHKTIYAYVKSITGKLSAVSNYEIKDRIDKVAPTISIASKSVKTNSISLTATVTDNVVGVDLTALKCKYKKNAETTYTDINADTTGNITIPNLTHNTLYNLELTYTDKAGNVATVTDTATTLLLDTPVISIDKTDANWYKQKIATIDYKSYKDNATYKYKKDAEVETTLNNISATNLTFPVTFTTNGSISATVTDGTNTLTANANITNVDSVIPIITTITANNIMATETNINITSTENLSGIVKYMYRYGTDINAAAWTDKPSTATTIDIPLTNLTQLTAYTFEVKAVDNAGNESVVKQINFTTLEEIKFKPVIKAGLTPIKWDASNAVVTTTDTDTEWSDYQNKKWANAQTKDGSMWTWIPRYAYRIIYYDKPVVNNVAPAGGNIIGYSDNRGLVDKNGVASTKFNRLNGRVEIVFLGADNFKYLDGDKFVGDVRKTGGTDNPNNYVIHPAFSAVRRTGYTKKADGNFGNTKEIPGFWVSKFGMAEYYISKPNYSSRTQITISAIFQQGKNIASAREITGGDSMAMTITQWGAVAYLAKGSGREPDKNANGFLTGNGDYIRSANQSTTGNATGVYDLSGCASEYLASYLSTGTLTNSDIQNLTQNKDTKYVDVYAVGSGNTSASNYEANADKYGDAVYEVSTNGVNNPRAWSNSNSQFPITSTPVFHRGEAYMSTASGIFSINYYTGQPYEYIGWRRSFHFLTSIRFTQFRRNSPVQQLYTNTYNKKA